MTRQGLRRFIQVFAGRPRLLAGVVAGLAAVPVLPHSVAGATRAILAWDIGTTVFLASSAAMFFSERLDRMPDDAKAQQEGEWTVFAVTLLGAVASLAALFTEFSHASDVPKADRSIHAVLLGYTLFASWLGTQTLFALRYAHEFYTRTGDAKEVDGGLEFPGEKRPDYLDFMYFSLVLAMTFQVSDVQITSRKLRRLATLHGFLGFIYNTVILALTINLAAGML